jgi:hypothetical protein
MEYKKICDLEILGRRAGVERTQAKKAIEDGFQAILMEYQSHQSFRHVRLDLVSSTASKR